MKRIELRPYDWCIWEAEGKKCLYQVRFDTFLLDDDVISNFRGVPILKETLKRNGFIINEKDNYAVFIDKFVASNTFTQFRNFISINLNPPYNVMVSYQYEDSNNNLVTNTITATNVRYIHQLQHMLIDSESTKEIYVNEKHFAV